MTAFSKHEESLLSLATHVSNTKPSMFWFWVSGIALGTGVLLKLAGDTASREDWIIGLLVMASFAQAFAYVRYRDRALRLISKLSSTQTS